MFLLLFLLMVLLLFLDISLPAMEKRDSAGHEVAGIHSHFQTSDVKCLIQLVWFYPSTTRMDHFVCPDIPFFHIH